MKILVHLHIFYHDQAEYFAEKLRNITIPDWNLIVTWNEPNDCTRKTISSIKPDALFTEVENSGFDIWPFLKVMMSTDILQYDYIIKLHTKGPAGKPCKVNGIRLSGYRWRDILVGSLLESPDAFRQMNNIFENEPDTGMVCSAILYTKARFKEDGSLLKAELQRIGISSDENRFCAGTIFAIRPQVLSPVLRHGYAVGDFPSVSQSHTGGTLAHVMERVLSILPSAAGYSVHTVGATLALKINLAFREYFQNGTEWLFSINRIGEDYVKYLTLFGIRIRLEN